MSSIMACESSQNRSQREAPSSNSPNCEPPLDRPRLPSSASSSSPTLQDTITQLESCKKQIEELEEDKRPYADYHNAYLVARNRAAKAQFQAEEWQDEYELQCHNHDNNHRVPAVENARRNLEDARKSRDVAEQNLLQYTPWSHGNYKMECQQRYLVEDIQDLESWVEEQRARGEWSDM
ncbi:hypothetical protein ACMFMG_003722 [Clarireedia jacksonii]